MVYTIEMEIDLPREKVIALFDSSDNLKHWQPGLQTFDHISGEPGQVGSKSQIHFIMGHRRIEMVETITVRNLPDEFSATYETNGVWNGVNNYFKEAGNKTRWITKNEFKFKGGMQIIGFLFKKSFPKQTKRYMKYFRAYAEKGESVLNKE